MNVTQHQESSQNFKDIFSKVGQLTRLLRDSIANLGLDRAIMDVAEAIPDTRARLNYVVGKTSEAAECALTCVENARPLQDQLSARASGLSQRWDAWFADPVALADAKALVSDTRRFLGDTPELAGKTNKQLMEIMMAQDFQDLTGQVIQHLMVLIENIERELVQVLLENMPEMLPEYANRKPESLKNGPQVNQNVSGIMASQDQVDDLLETLGF
ncbi:protein phosphatase CheZ [Pluralibacter gergoviae]|uniref:protein phosphatase CheZ n=1 Tax=Pluralibacter gergoviae TaxID=61647 RepID=UPI000A378929|nr:protein phosphatase CheZ [Pluralibacter gergoviae]EKT9640868.1 protein phosphatase CheZ [Pluralibacter gergoviae]EKV3541518.1 protein phosphatase CheZ [Pluralibacter gergoviae]EKV9899726.1 protein phosphatase CheZ [Pluralibacter gergoviae]EKV9930906.1 protein phosphatase CheZ [Pluralibacter gergoviae]EKW9977332.1 protein phosphatase CheZ [Pluralibacter gergoviae]